MHIRASKHICRGILEASGFSNVQLVTSFIGLKAFKHYHKRQNNGNKKGKKDRKKVYKKTQ